MRFKEFQKLRKLQLDANRYQSFTRSNKPSKRSIKSQGNGTGMILKKSYLIDRYNRRIITPDDSLACPKFVA